MFALVVVILILTYKTVVSNENVTQDQPLSLTEVTNSSSVSVKKVTTKEDDNYVDPEIQAVWRRYLKDKYERWKRTKNSQTPPMMKNSDAVTESYASTNKTPSVGANGTSSVPDTSHATQNDTLTSVPKDENDANVTRPSGEMEFTKTLQQERELLRFKSNISAYNETRRQGPRGMKGKGGDGYGAPPTEKKKRFKGFREPYWLGGDEIYLITGTPTRKDEASLKNPMSVYRSCEQPCLIYYKKYGKICGRRYDPYKTINVYRNFEDICDLDRENCIDPNSRPRFVPMYKGKCAELKGFPKMLDDPTNILIHKKKYHPYSYKPPTTSLKPPPKANSDDDDDSDDKW